MFQLSIEKIKRYKNVPTRSRPNIVPNQLNSSLSEAGVKNKIVKLIIERIIPIIERDFRLIFLICSFIDLFWGSKISQNNVVKSSLYNFKKEYRNSSENK
jgi:hypothetical protein